MAGITDVLERLVTDPSFKQQIERSPEAALAGYDLTDDDLRMLASQVSSDTGGDHHVEARTSRSALFSLFTQIGDATGSAPGAMRAEPVDVPETPDWQVDTDGDGLSDQYEEHIGTDPNTPDQPYADTDGDGWEEPAAWVDDAKWTDTDHDGLTDWEELKLGTNPLHPDTDGDGLTDGEEVGGWVNYGDPNWTDPTSADTDGDGLSDLYETKVTHTNPQQADTDGDGIPDFQELMDGTDPTQDEPASDSTMLPEEPTDLPHSPMDHGLDDLGGSSDAPDSMLAPSSSGAGADAGLGGPDTIIDPGSSPEVIDPGSSQGIIDPGSSPEVIDPDLSHEVTDPDLNQEVTDPDLIHEVTDPDINQEILDPGSSQGIIINGAPPEVIDPDLRR